MSYIQPHDNSRRASGFLAVVLLHVALAYALVNGLARKIVDVVQQPFETKVLEETKPKEDKPPPPPPPKMALPPPPFIPPPEIRVDAPASANAITQVSTTKPPAEVPKVATPARTAPVVLARDCQKPEYPSASLRAQETGLVVLQLLVGVDGLVSDSRVERSSGYKRLDEAARKALSLCKFKPGTVEGKPEASWARIEYDWKIE